MQLSRRELFRLIFGAGLLAASGYIFRNILFPPEFSPQEKQTLAAVLDTLIPADATPGALQLGVAEKLQEKAKTDTQYRRLLRQGCAWLDSQARKRQGSRYASLAERDRGAILTLAEGSGDGSFQRMFFLQLRTDGFHYYYGHAGSWPQLGYPGPPQPRGFADYDAAPRRPG